jgi:hypothetical protein
LPSAKRIRNLIDQHLKGKFEKLDLVMKMAGRRGKPRKK